MRFSVFGSGKQCDPALEPDDASTASAGPSAVLIGVAEASVSAQRQRGAPSSSVRDLGLELAVEGIENASLDAIVSLIGV